MFRLFFFLFQFTLFMTIGFSAATIDNQNDVEVEFFSPQFPDGDILPGSQNSVGPFSTIDVDPSLFGFYILHPNNPDLVLEYLTVNTDGSTEILNPMKYDSQSWLSPPGNVCIPSIDVSPGGTGQATIRGNFNFGSQQDFIYNTVLSQSLELKKIRDNNIHMKTFVYKKVEYDYGGTEPEVFYLLPNQVEQRYTYNSDDYNQPGGTTYSTLQDQFFTEDFQKISDSFDLEPGEGVPYVLVEPADKIITFNDQPVRDFLNQLDENCEESQGLICDGNLREEIFAIPIDGKCDFDYDPVQGDLSTIDTTEVNPLTVSIPTTPPLTFPRPRPNTNSTVTIDDSDFEIEEGSFTDTRRPGFESRYYELTVGGTNVQKTYIPPRRVILDRNADTVTFIDANALRSSPISTNNPIRKRAALLSHKITTIHTDLELNDFINSVEIAMNELRPTQKKTEILGSNQLGRERVEINFKEGAIIPGHVLYKVFPKGYDISSIVNLGTANMFIKDRDPVIGWHIDDPGDEIEYEGDEGDGTIIITEDASLYNLGDITVNYRDTGSCLPEEVHLFDLQDLENSNIYDPGTEFYAVCISHDTYTLFGDGTTGDVSATILDYDGPSGVMSTSGTYTNFVEISTNQILLTEAFDIKVQQDAPSDDYSCIGSYDILSKFGDCDFEPTRRIWIALTGTDTTGPSIDFTYPSLSNSIPVTIDVEDTESGVAYFKYCVTDDPAGCDPSLEDAIAGESTTTTISCPDDWGCVKHMSVIAQDNVGNLNTVTKEFRLIDKGSACRADCTAAPSPNRFLADCRNLNGCFYASHPDDGGDSGITVANACDFLTPGSYADYNDTHEIKCPSGPLRDSRYSDLVLTTQGSSCDFIKTTPYPVFLEGQQMVLSIVSCANFNWN